MQRIGILAVLLLVPLSGCLGFGDDSGTDPEVGSTGTNTNTNTGNNTNTNTGNNTGTQTSEPTPNVSPVIVLTISDADGNPLDPAVVETGATLTFSAVGTNDTDGMLDGVGIIINKDKPDEKLGILYTDGAFVDQTYTFDNPGALNVTVNALDEDGGTTVGYFAAYVNSVSSESGNHPIAASATVVDPEDCVGPSTGTTGSIVDNQYSSKASFEVTEGARWIEATQVSGSVEFAICDKDENNLSTSSTSSTSTADNPDGMEPSTNGYYIFVVGTAPGDWEVNVTIHYEPKP